MKNRIVAVAVMALLSVLAVGAVGSAQAKIGLIDLAVIMDESKAGQQGNAILQAAVAERQQVVSDMEAELIALEEALSDVALTDAERVEILAALEEAAAEFSQTVQLFEAEIDQIVQALRSQIIADVRFVVQLVAEQGGFDLVMDVEDAYYYRSAIDLTHEVIREYDELWDAARASEEAEEAQPAEQP